MTKQLPFPCRLRRRQLLLLLQIGVFLCCCNKTAAFAFADAEAEVAASTATSNKMNAGDASTITDDTLDEAIIDPASILLAEYFAANSQEETLFEKAKALTLSRIRALNREMEAMLKPVVMTLFDPQYKATEAMVKLTYHIYVKERRGKDTIVDSEGNIDLEKFERWFIQKMKLADELRQRQRKQILEKKLEEFQQEFMQEVEQATRDFVEDLENNARAWQEENRRAEWWSRVALGLLFVVFYAAFMLWDFLFPNRE